jgi:hypothetical protein
MRKATLKFFNTNITSAKLKKESAKLNSSIITKNQTIFADFHELPRHIVSNISPLASQVLYMTVS